MRNSENKSFTLSSLTGLNCRELLAMMIGSFLYAVGLHFYIFPAGIILGGTGGVSVVLSKYLEMSSDIIITIINTALLVLAFVILGKHFAVRTVIGSSATTVFVYVLNLFFPIETASINQFVAAIVGATLIAVGGGLLFYYDSSSGGTDIIALIVKKYTHTDIVRALFVTDILIVIVGSIMMNDLLLGLATALGFVIKIAGMEGVICFLKKLFHYKNLIRVRI